MSVNYIALGPLSSFPADILFESGRRHIEVKPGMYILHLSMTTSGGQAGYEVRILSRPDIRIPEEVLANIPSTSDKIDYTITASISTLSSIIISITAKNTIDILGGSLTIVPQYV